MKSWILAAALGMTAIAPASAQTTQALAYKLADVTVGENFKDVKVLIDGAFDNLQKTAAASGKSDRTLEIWVEEMKNAMNRENFIKVIGDVWARDMTRDELQQALDFFASPVGRKFQMASETVKSPRNLAPIFRDACDRAKSRVTAAGGKATDLDAACSQFR